MGSLVQICRHNTQERAQAHFIQSTSPALAPKLCLKNCDLPCDVTQKGSNGRQREKGRLHQDTRNRPVPGPQRLPAGLGF